MELNVTRRFVVLFQSENSPNQNKYIKLLEEACINAKTIPTLSFNYINEEKLHKSLLNVDDYGGLIFTSIRGVNAVSSALNLCTDSCVAMWREKNNFSVGKATAALAKSLMNFDTLGSDSGNSENLCHFIIEKFGKAEKPLIFPCSSIRRDTIFDTLSQHNIPLEEITCYETVPNPLFETLWKELVLKEGLPEIVIFFSPSGVQYCGEIVKNSYSGIAKPKFVALGTSTGKALSDANMIPFKISETPNPESVLCAIQDLLDS